MSKIVLRVGHHCRERCRCGTGMLQAQQVLLGAQWQAVLYESRALCLAWHCPARVGNLRCAPHQSHSHLLCLLWLCPCSPCSFSSCFSSSSPPQEIIHFLSSPSHPQLFPTLFSMPSLEDASLHGFPRTFLFQSRSWVNFSTWLGEASVLLRDNSVQTRSACCPLLPAAGSFPASSSLLPPLLVIPHTLLPTSDFSPYLLSLFFPLFIAGSGSESYSQLNQKGHHNAT